jgi:outer membrane protein
VSFLRLLEVRDHFNILAFLAVVCSGSPCIAQTNIVSDKTATCSELKAPDLAKLSLPMALDHALCVNPSVRQATYAIAEKQSDIDLAQLSYRPRVSAALSANSSRTAITSDNTNPTTQNISSSIGLNWLLFDFGQRDATLAQTRSQLSSTVYGLNNVKSLAVSETLRLYTDALSIWLRLENLKDAEKVAEQSLRAATAKYNVQVGSLSEKLQAQTALSQTSLELIRANGQWETARAALAVHMGFPVFQKIGMPALEVAVPFIGIETNIDDMLLYMRENHPRLKSLQADAASLRSKGAAVVAEGRGSISFNASGQINRALNLSQSQSNTVLDKNLSASVSGNIPLFNRDEIDAKLAQINAQADTKLSLLEAVQRDLDIELLRQVLVVRTEIETKLAARVLASSAEQNYKVALGRYLNGVGTIVDLLTAQSALSAARLALDITYLSQATARLRLVAIVGRLPPKTSLATPNWVQ